MKTSKAVKAVKVPVTSPGSRDASGRSGRVGSKRPARVAGSWDAPATRQNRSGEASRVEPPPSPAVGAPMLSTRNGKAARSGDASRTVRSGKKASTGPRAGFVCPPCGRFVPTSVEGVVLRDGRGSPPRFCSPSCRQAAYRRRRAGVAEDVPLLLGGGRDRSLKRSGRGTARQGRRKNA
jgi:hypothetical protein